MLLEKPPKPIKYVEFSSIFQIIFFIASPQGEADKHATGIFLRVCLSVSCLYDGLFLKNYFI